MTQLAPEHLSGIPEHLRKELGNTLRRHAAELRLLAKRIDPPKPKVKASRCLSTDDWVSKMYAEEGAT